MTFFVDANYTDNSGHSDVYTIDLNDLDWDDVKDAIVEMFKWEEEYSRHIDFVEIWEEDCDDPIKHYTREEAQDFCNPVLKHCRSIWRTV